MQPTISATAAIYVKGRSDQKIQIEIEKLNEYLTNDGCTLAGPDQVYVDGEDNLRQLAKLVKQAPKHKIRVVYVVHDLLATERQKYRSLINKLYVQGISILICE